MLRAVLVVASALALAACGSTPGPASPDLPGLEADSTEALPSNEFDTLDARLDLTDEQEASVRQSLDALAEDLVAARRLPTLRERAAARQRARVEADARILATLTTSQRETFNAIRAAREPDLEPGVRRQLADLTRRLELTDDQQRALAPILTRQAERIEPLADRVRRGGDRDDAIEEALAIRDETDAEILALLDERQAERYQRIIDSRDDRGRRTQRR